MFPMPRYSLRSMDVESLRSRYRPKHVRVLLVGESPPAGGTFFYAANSNLFRYTKEAFEAVYGQHWARGTDFLDFFAGEGFFLDDLCLVPVNNLTPADRRRCRRDGIPALASRIRDMSPIAVAVTPKAITREVSRALQLAGINSEPVALAFPAMSWQRAYVEAFTAFLRDVRA